jgi:hypothetical protein
MLGKKPLKVEESWLFGTDPRKFEREIGLKKPLKVENPCLQMIRETGRLENVPLREGGHMSPCSRNLPRGARILHETHFSAG